MEKIQMAEMNINVKVLLDGNGRPCFEMTGRDGQPFICYQSGIKQTILDVLMVEANPVYIAANKK